MHGYVYVRHVCTQINRANQQMGSKLMCHISIDGSQCGSSTRPANTACQVDCEIPYLVAYAVIIHFLTSHSIYSTSPVRVCAFFPKAKQPSSHTHSIAMLQETSDYTKYHNSQRHYINTSVKPKSIFTLHKAPQHLIIKLRHSQRQHNVFSQKSYQVTRLHQA